MGAPSRSRIMRSSVGGVRSGSLPVRMGMVASLNAIRAVNMKRRHSSKLELGAVVRITSMSGRVMLEDMAGKMDGF